MKIIDFTPPDTLPYDQSARRDYSPLVIAGFLVRRWPLRGTPYVVYSVTKNDQELGRQISFPDVRDCEYHRRAFEAREGYRVKRALHVETFETTSLTDRIVDVLKLERMGLGRLSGALKHEASTIAPILTRLIKQERILRRGQRGKYVYEARNK